MNPPGPKLKPSTPVSTRRRIIIISVVLGAFAGLVAILLPFAVREMASSRIDRAAASLNGSVTHGDISIAGLSTLTIPTMKFVDGTGIEIRADEIRIEVDPLAMLIGGRRITNVAVKHLDVKGGSRDKPFDLGGVAGRLASGSPAPAAGGGQYAEVPGGTKRARKGVPMPEVTISSITGSVFTSVYSGIVESGSASLGPAPDTMDAFAKRFVLQLALRPDGADTVSNVEVTADMESPRRVTFAAATISPSMTRNIRGVDVGIGGLQWRQGEIGIMAPVAVLPGSSRFPAGLRADEIRVKWSARREGDRPALDLIPGSMLRYVPESLKILAGTVTVSDIRVKRPVVEIMASAPLPEPASGGAAPTLPSESVQKRITRLFSGLAGKIESSRSRLVEVAKVYDGTRVGITGATVTYLADRDRAAKAAQSYSNLDLQVERGPDGALIARVRFECPESASTLNEFDVGIQPDGTIRMALKAKFLKLAPYQVLLPSWLETDSRTALTETDVVMTMAQGPRLEISGRFGVSDATLFLREVASEPMRNVDLALSGSTVFDGPGGTVTMNESILSLGEIALPFSFSGRLMNEAPRLSLVGRIERLSGEALLTSIPREAIPVLSGARLSGTFAATVRLDVDTADLSKLVFDFVPDMADLVTIDLGPAVNLELLRSTFLHRIEDRDHVVTRTIGVGSPGWVAFEDVPDYFIRALTISEDARFFQHKGFSRAGIQRSLKVNLEKGGFFQGASTLSQQLVKNLFLSREKTLSRKLQEAFITWQVERNLPKEKILELYLNVIEWGPEVWGLKEAATHYFARDPSQLTVLEAAFLVLIIPNPSKYHEFLEQGQVPPRFMTKVRALVETLRSVGAISDLEALGTLQQTVRFPVAAGVEQAVPDSEFAD